MKKLRSNKGVTGIDVALSITIIVIVLGVVLSVYSNYSDRTKQVNRNAKATNLAVQVIEGIEADDDLAEAIIESEENKFEIVEENNEEYFKDKDTYGIEELPKGYKVEISKNDSTGNEVLDKVATKIVVTVDYTIGEQTEKVSLNTIKTKWNEEAQEPDLKMLQSGYIPIKYNKSKNRYEKTIFTDPDWYSVSDKRFAMVANPNVIDEKGIVNLELCDNSNSIQIWLPALGKEEIDNIIKYKFVKKISEKTGNIIYYNYDEEKNISYYEKDNLISEFSEIYGNDWYKINLITGKVIKRTIFSTADEEYTETYNIYINNSFTWEEPEQ